MSGDRKGVKPWRISGDGQLLLAVRLTPKADKDVIDGVVTTQNGDALRARVRAVPEKGKANAALVKLLANWLDLPKSSISLVAGSKSRIKTLAFGGDGDAIIARLTTALAETDPS